MADWGLGSLYSFMIHLVFFAVSLWQYHSSSIGAQVENGNLDGSQFEEKTIAQISQIENSAARVVCELKNSHTDQASNPSLINNVLGVVATLGKVEDENLSRPYIGELAAGDPQKKLALPKPRLPNGTCPSRFIDFAVNMINVEIANSSCLTASGLGLRETSFYSLFSRLQVYKTRTDMMSALPGICDGALSLDGGMIKRTGFFSLGSR
ncbi:hypothetical protein Syun_019735 [Stephania yunnanensis]|uniref:Uncharacterized protein n=1 Tax=Stephania yunnanensis TaxID=152371 RepID=A0AAP0IWC6_9MAGN